MKLSLIAAMEKTGRGIGKDGELLFRIPDDLKRFRELTIGKPVIMGRKTFESIGRPLPGRTNIIVSRSWSAPADMPVLVFRSLVDAFHYLVEEEPFCHAFAIGGAEIYKQCLPWADDIYLTEVTMLEKAEADVFFPSIPSHFVEDRREVRQGSLSLGISRYDFVHYSRQRKF